MASGLEVGRNDERESNNKELTAKLFVEEFGHHVEGFFCFRQLEVIPEGVRQGFENEELRVVACAEQSAMEHGRVAQEQIASAGDQQARRHAFEVGEERR